MTRIIVYLSERELEALQRLAERDLRGLREQARFLIVRGLAAEIGAHAQVDIGTERQSGDGHHDS